MPARCNYFSGFCDRARSARLKKAGFDAVACHDGGEAMAFINTRTPAAAVIDIHLPDINGLVLAKTLRDRFGAATPIIVVSGDTSMQTLNSLSTVGATHF